jgi:hypothetical protein
MSEESTRWTIVVDKSTDINLRSHLAARRIKKGDLSKYVEAAVKRALFQETLAELREGFKDLTADEGLALIDEAVASVRKR